MTFSKIQKKTLELLLKKYEASKTYNENNEITQSFSISPEKVFSDYTNDFADVDKIHDFENDLETLEKIKLVAIFKKNDRINKITAISMDENWNRIRQILGVKDKNTRLKEETDFYSAIYDDSSSDQIVKDFCKQQIERLETGKKAQFVHEESKNIIALLNYILKNKNEILERELSISLLSNSKTWEEKYKKKILKILRQNEPFASLAENCADEKETDKAILEECNIFSNPSYVYFKGSGTITFENGNCIKIFPDIPLALSSAAISKIEIFEIADNKIMTVENLTSFNRIKKTNTFFIFLSGYHNSAKQIFLKKIFNQNSNKEYYHFGDIDPDGFLILDNLRSKTQIDFKAYKMGIAELQKYSSYTKPLEKNDLRKAESLITKGKYTEILDYMLKRNLKLEQEIISWKEES
ncbi:Wadjet anti-phage system protein JetD domain-containing protein [uncultured Treponema sp.]|uniref:Wadjet anti-phage system protein JetD domain-containing protein n=1 Tax=uncultured Treponema sp. TaxID=162155 RepID=UPI0026226350|nr:Wadjet anti-phage system protein JetD domain-containing protein [uncultured Treponema sp.]